MASRFALGFLGGAAKYGADYVERRQDDEADLRKAKMLQELRAQQDRADFLFEDDIRTKHTNVQLSGPDYTTGKFVFRDSEGNVKSERDLTDAEKTAYRLDAAKDELGVENIRSEIASRAHDDANSDARLRLDTAQTAASIAASNASTGYSLANTKHIQALDTGGPAGGGDPDLAAAGSLLTKYKNEINSVKAGNRDVAGANTDNSLDDVAIRQAALAIVKNSRTGAEAEEAFNKWLIRANKGLAQKNGKRLIRLDQ